MGIGARRGRGHQAALDAVDTYDQRVNAFVWWCGKRRPRAKQSEARWH